MFVSSQHHFKLDKFEGPLDLLLRLIEDQELAITEVSLAAVADQFVSYVNNNQHLSASELADFLVIAAKLLALKSHALLAAPEMAEEASDLEKQLKIYKEYYEATKKVAKILAARNFMFSRQKSAVAFVPKFSPPEKLQVKDFALSFAEVLQRLQIIIDLPKKAIAKVISIGEKISHIKDLIAKRLHLGFNNILKVKDRTEIIVSFLAILELAKQQTILLEQQEAFAEITIRRREADSLELEVS